MDRLVLQTLNNALWSVNSMLNSEDPTQWYSTVVRIEKVGFPWAYSWIVKSISDFITWIKVEASGQIRSAADYIGEWIETGPRKTHLFNTIAGYRKQTWKTIISHVTRTLINTLTIPVATHSTMKITNVVCSAHLNCTIDLISLCQRLRNCRYEPRSFPSLIWQHRNIDGNCLVFANGVINSNGKASSFREGRKRLCRYARLLQKYGCPVYLTDAKIITAQPVIP